MLRVLVISDVAYGGAGVACRRLCLGLARSGEVAVRWMASEGFDHEFARTTGQWPSAATMLWWRAMRWMRLNANPAWRPVQNLYSRMLQKAATSDEYDVIHLHNIHETLTFSFIAGLPRKPIVWTLHDMWPVTGYCCYSYECEKYMTGCAGVCPQWGKWGPQSRQPGCEWISRDREYSRRACTVTMVAPSRWLASCAERRFAGKVPVAHIPYGFPLDVFTPLHDRHAVRAALGLPVDGRIVLIGSQVVDDSRKGFQYIERMVKALCGSNDRKTEVVAFGQHRESSPGGVRCVGVVNDPRILNQYYNAADIYLAPTLADNLPNTLIESMAAGTPCVAFETGGVPDIISHMRNGYLAKYGDGDDLLHGIETLLGMDMSARERMRDEARRTAESKFDLRMQADAYTGLYGRVMGVK